MVDNRPLVYQTLSTLTYPVDYNYPEKMNFFPCISYFDSGHVPTDYADGKAKADITETTVDVWEKMDSQGVFIEIHCQVDQVMREAGFYRTAFVNQFEDDTKIQHVTFKFTKIEMEVNP